MHGLPLEQGKHYHLWKLSDVLLDSFTAGFDKIMFARFISHLNALGTEFDLKNFKVNLGSLIERT